MAAILSLSEANAEIERLRAELEARNRDLGALILDIWRAVDLPEELARRAWKLVIHEVPVGLPLPCPDCGRRPGVVHAMGCKRANVNDNGFGDDEP